MTRAASGEIIVTCPVCGEAVTASVYVASVELTNFDQLAVAFTGTRVDHECKGAHR